MSEYSKEQTRDLISRSSRILTEYTGKYPATLLVNCLLGLLVIPKERLLKLIPKDGPSAFPDWGLDKARFNSFGSRHRTRTGKPVDYDPDTIRGIVHSMRNAVAHFNLEVRNQNGKATGFRFTTTRGFNAEFSRIGLKTFVQRVAEKLEAACLKTKV